MDPRYAILTRRRLIQFGIGGYLGLSLGGLWHAQAMTRSRDSKIRSCIFIFFYGGPSHIDTFDPKPDAPAEVRGEFRTIPTSVPGLRLSEHLPRLACRAHKFALIRSVHHSARLHDSASIHTLTGRPLEGPDRELFAPIAQHFPSLGGAVAYANRTRNILVPHAALPFVFRNVVDVPCQGGGFLGSAFDPLRIDVDTETRSYRLAALERPEDLSCERVRVRRDLVAAISSGKVPQPAKDDLRPLYDKAYRLMESDDLRNAIDLSQEPPAVRDSYGLGPNDDRVAGPTGGAEHGYARNMRGQNLLLARRLVEAGVPFVNVYDFKQQGQNWDAHADNFVQHRKHLLPATDRGLSALIEDLDRRGLLESTLVVAVGEFGRTPIINRNAGRDHWPDCYTALLAGGGIRGGAVYGSSDRIGAFPASDPVSPGDLAATIFWRFGIDPDLEIRDTTDRPHKLADGRPITELFDG
jgi:hypothetical protein